MHRHDNTTPAETRIMCQFFFQSSLTVPRLLQYRVSQKQKYGPKIKGESPYCTFFPTNPLLMDQFTAFYTKF